MFDRWNPLHHIWSKLYYVVVPATVPTASSSNENNYNSDNYSQQNNDSNDGGWDQAVRDHLHVNSSSTRKQQYSLEYPNHATEIHFIRQKNSWDCGIACLQMVLEWIRIGQVSPCYIKNHKMTMIEGVQDTTASLSSCQQDEEYHWMLQQINTQSIWTVDLVLLLDHLLLLVQDDPNITCNQSTRITPPMARFLFATQCLYVNNDWATFPYYASAFSDDRVRIERAFELLQQKGIPVYQMPRCGLSMDQVIHVLMDEDCIAIMLVDSNILRQTSSLLYDNGVHEPSIMEDDEHMDNSSDQQQCYSGHYVVVAGIIQDNQYYQPNRTMMIIYNPASTENGPTLVDIELLELAWRAPGTDQDIILIVRSPPTLFMKEQEESVYFSK